jgi:hypothetical protein
MLSAYALAIDPVGTDLSYLNDYKLEVLPGKTEITKNYKSEEFKGSFKALIQDKKSFGEIEFELFSPVTTKAGIVPQLTVVLPNLSPLLFIDENIAKGLAERGSHVLLIKTGITLKTYLKEISDFNHIIRKQILFTHHALNFTLNHFPAEIKQVQSLGVSLGGILSAIMLSIDPRISSGITLMAGAGYKDDKHLGIIADIGRMLKGTSKQMSPGIALDPKELASGYAHKRIRLYMTRKDLFVPPERQLELKALFENPEVVMLRGMHVQNALFSPKKVQAYFNFFNAY